MHHMYTESIQSAPKIHLFFYVLEFGPPLYEKKAHIKKEHAKHKPFLNP